MIKCFFHNQNNDHIPWNNQGFRPGPILILFLHPLTVEKESILDLNYCSILPYLAYTSLIFQNHGD